MLELITEAMARRYEFKYLPDYHMGTFECEEYQVYVSKETGKYMLTDLVSPVTGTFSTAVEVMSFITQYKNG